MSMPSRTNPRREQSDDPVRIGEEDGDDGEDAEVVATGEGGE